MGRGEKKLDALGDGRGNRIMKGYIFFNKACCLYCRKVFEVRYKNRKWHNCPESLRERKRLQRQKVADWHAANPNVDYYRKVKKLVPKEEKKYRCQKCGAMTHNRFRCPACWSYAEKHMGSFEDLMGYPVIGMRGGIR
jgi:hypothetical protein